MICHNTLNNSIDEIKHKSISFENVKIKESELNDLKESFIAETESEKARTDELISRLRDLEDPIARVTVEINSLRDKQAAKEALLHYDIASMQSDLDDLENNKEAESALNSFLGTARDHSDRLKFGDEISQIVKSVTASIDDFIVDHMDQPQYDSKAESIKTTINDAIDSLISSKEQVFFDVDAEDDYEEDSVVEEPGIDINYKR